MLPLALQPEVLARNDFFLSLSTYTFPPRHAPPLRAAIDTEQVDRSLTRSQSSLSLTRPAPISSCHSADINAIDIHLDMPAYTLPRSSSLPALRLRSASNLAPPPPMPPYIAEVYAYGTYVSSMRKVRHDTAKEVFRDASDDEDDGKGGWRQDEGPGEVLDLITILQEKSDMETRGPHLRLTGNHALYHQDAPSRSHGTMKKRYPFRATRAAPPPPTPRRNPMHRTPLVKIDVSVPPVNSATQLEGLTSSTSSSSGSDTELCSPLTSTLYTEGVSDNSTRSPYLRVEDSIDQRAEDIDIFSALKWRHSAAKIDGLPVLPPIPKMTDLMEGLFSGSTTPGRDDSPERGAKDVETDYNSLLPSYTTSTSFPHLAQLASPFLHPRPAPSPPSLSLPTAVARTPTISKVQPIPSCFPSIESSGRGGLSALGLVLEGDEPIAEHCRPAKGVNGDVAKSSDAQIDEDPFRRSFNLLRGDQQALAPSHFGAINHPVPPPKTPKMHRQYRHSFRPLSAFSNPTEQYVPYTPPGQVRTTPLRSATEKAVPSKVAAHLGMSRSMSNLHLPLANTGIGSWPVPTRELINRFDPDNGSDEASTCDTARRRSPRYRIGRTLTRTRSGFGALLRGRGVPHAPKLAPSDLRPETPHICPSPETARLGEKVRGGRLASKWGLDKLDGRWIRMGLGRRRSSD